MTYNVRCKSRNQQFATAQQFAKHYSGSSPEYTSVGTVVRVDGSEFIFFREGKGRSNEIDVDTFNKKYFSSTQK